MIDSRLLCQASRVHDRRSILRYGAAAITGVTLATISREAITAQIRWSFFGVKPEETLSFAKSTFVPAFKWFAAEVLLPMVEVLGRNAAPARAMQLLLAISTEEFIEKLRPIRNGRDDSKVHRYSDGVLLPLDLQVSQAKLRGFGVEFGIDPKSPFELNALELSAMLRMQHALLPRGFRRAFDDRNDRRSLDKINVLYRKNGTTPIDQDEIEYVQSMVDSSKRQYISFCASRNGSREIVFGEE